MSLGNISTPKPKSWLPYAQSGPLFLDMNRWYTDHHWDWVSGPPNDGVGLQEGQVLNAIALYGVGLEDSSLFYYQEQLKVTKESEICIGCACRACWCSRFMVYFH